MGRHKNFSYLWGKFSELYRLKCAEPAIIVKWAMDKPSGQTDLQEQLRKLQEKYAVMGQDLSSYLDGFVIFWLPDVLGLHYLDTLLSLQNPKKQVFLTSGFYHVSSDYRIVFQFDFVGT